MAAGWAGEEVLEQESRGLTQREETRRQVEELTAERR
jgi:hypothetical protein